MKTTKHLSVVAVLTVLMQMGCQSHTDNTRQTLHLPELNEVRKALRVSVDPGKGVYFPSNLFNTSLVVIFLQISSFGLQKASSIRTSFSSGKWSVCRVLSV